MHNPKHYLTKKSFEFFIFLWILFQGVYTVAQSDCSTAYRVCTNATTGGNVSGYGIDDFYGAQQSGCLINKVDAVEVNSFWFRIKLTTSGKFGFNINPAAGEDWDFAVYGPYNTSCGALGDPIRCNFAFDPSQLPTEVISTGVGNSSTYFDEWLDVNAGDEFLILVNKFDAGSVSGFEIEWTGDVFNNTSTPLDCSIKSNLGEDKKLCRDKNPSWLLSAKLAGVNQADIIYNWFADYGSGEVHIFPDAATPWLYEVTVDGTYRVEVTDTNTGDFFDDEINISFYDTPFIDTQPNSLIECDAGNNTAIFDLTQNESLIIGNQTNVTVKYYATETNAMLDFISFDNPEEFESDGTTIWVRIENEAKCYALTSFDISVIDQPQINGTPNNISICDSDNSTDELIDLTVNSSILIGDQENMIVLFDDDPDPDTRWKLPLQDPENYIAPLGTTTIWAIVVPESNYDGTVINSDCPFNESTFEVTVYQTPIANAIPNVYQCDDDGVFDGYYNFNFSTQTSDILGTLDANLFDVLFYTDVGLTNQIDLSSGTYTNAAPYIEETIYVKVQNKNNTSCFDTTNFNIQVVPKAVLADEITPLIECDNTSDSENSDTNGINNVDLTQKSSEILNGQSNTTFKINYYEDATYTHLISDPVNFENTIANQQTIYVEVVNNINGSNGCSSYTSFNLIINENPVILDSYDFTQCENNTGETIFNLNEAVDFLTLNNPNLNIGFFTTETLAEENDSANLLPSEISYNSDPDHVIYARIENANCYRIAQINLLISKTSFPSGYGGQTLNTCDDDSIADGLHTFRLSEATAEIVTLFINNSSTPAPIVSYYRTEEDALLENNPIDPTADYMNEAALSYQVNQSNLQDIYVRVEDNNNGGCYGIGPYVTLEVYLRPEFELPETDFICTNDLPKTIYVENPQGTYTYEWFDAQGNSIKNSADTYVEVTEEGVYSVIATSNQQCKSFEKQITLLPSNNAEINDIVIEEGDMYNTVTIKVTGLGDYEYTLNNPQGIYQNENTFTEVISGLHTVYVNDKNGCGLSLKEFYVLGFPKFFTPNADGENDTWNLRGVDTNYFPESIIYIFDRYGKQIYKMTANDKGWNGYYRGNPLPSTDYWFIAQLKDINGDIKQFKSHFSLIRR